MLSHRLGKTRQLSLEVAIGYGHAVFTFRQGTPPHKTMTTTNFTRTESIQELSDQDLEQVTGGFRLIRWIKNLFKFGKKKVVKDQNYWNNYHKNHPMNNNSSYQ